MKKSSDGTAVKPNIQRQPSLPEPRVADEFIRRRRDVADVRTSDQLMTCASKMPTTMVSWLMETSLPRICAGATSAIYMGERFDASPMATPPKHPPADEDGKVASASALPSEVTANRNADRISSRLRPELVAQRAGHQRADEAADERATVRPADLRLAGQLKIALEKRLRTADDDPIPAEQQSAKRGHGGDEPDVAEVEFGLEGRGFVWRRCNHDLGCC
jgi:hypothetical protein